MLKLIFNNTLAQLTAKFFGAGLTLLTTYYTIRLAGLDLYGDLTKVLVLVALGFTAIDFGLNADALRRANAKGSIVTMLPEVLLTRLFLALLAIITLNTLVYFLPGGYSTEVKSLFWLGSLAIIFQGLVTSSNAYFQYTLSYWRSTISVIIGSLLTTLLTFYFLYFNPSLFGLIFSNTIGYLAMATAALSFLPRSLSFAGLNFSLIFATLKRSAWLGFILLASILSSKTDTVLLGVFRPSLEVGQYGFAYRIFDVILVLPVFVMNALYPLMLKPGKNLLLPTLKYLGLLGVVAGLLTYLLAPAITLIRPDLMLSISTLQILAFALPLFYLTAPLMWHLITQKKDLIVLWIYCLAALFNAMANYYAIPHFGVYAAATITGLTELLIFVSLLYYSLKTKKQHKRF